MDELGFLLLCILLFFWFGQQTVSGSHVPNANRKKLGGRKVSRLLCI